MSIAEMKACWGEQGRNRSGLELYSLGFLSLKFDDRHLQVARQHLCCSQSTASFLVGQCLVPTLAMSPALDCLVPSLACLTVPGVIANTP